ncbi:MAG: DNA repair protein RecO [Planctomycetota bacterium]
MPTIQDQGLCIRHWDWSETSQTVSILTRNHGALRALAKGSKRENARFSGGVELLTLAAFQAIVKPHTELATLTEWDLVELFPALRRSLDRFHAAMYIADLLHHAVRDSDPHPGLFDAALTALRALGDQKSLEASVETALSIEPCLLRFQWALLVELGYTPVLDRDAALGGPLPVADRYLFSPRLGGLVAKSAPDGPSWGVRAQTVDCLRALAATSAEIDAQACRRANRLLASYIRELLGEQVPSLSAVFDLRELAGGPTGIASFTRGG